MYSVTELTSTEIQISRPVLNGEKLKQTNYTTNIEGDKLLLNFGEKFQD